ncbi:MAG: prepilin-type N-terminal cleavage/methylation domain-containing protein, partial [Alphaproteobacteria bacterium]|nr:prepilin-type N-terminal cleavage/methylation domain-containing protein [Alphaproteobacteria bacterium]
MDSLLGRRCESAVAKLPKISPIIMAKGREIQRFSSSVGNALTFPEYHEIQACNSRLTMTAIRKRNLAGFTLVELSIVLVIIALIAGAAITAGTTRLKTAKLNQTNLKLDKIEEAL